MWPDTRLLDLFGIELPIVQAPMANATAVDMAVAVANAGGLGSFPCAALTDDKVAEGVATIRSRTNRPINLNFFCHKPAPAGRSARRRLAQTPCALLRRAWRRDAEASAQGLDRAVHRGDLRRGRTTWRPPW